MNLDTGVSFVLATSSEMTPRLFNLDFQLLADATLTLIAVIALFFFASYFFFNPAREFLQKRQERIKNDIDSAKESKSEAEALKAEYEQKLKEINKEAETILSEARKKAIDNEQSIVAKAKDEARGIVERANSEAELEKQRVADDVKKEMINVASAMAQRVIGEKMDDSIQDRLVEDTLKEIGDGTWLS